MADVHNAMIELMRIEVDSIEQTARGEHNGFGLAGDELDAVVGALSEIRAVLDVAEVRLVNRPALGRFKREMRRRAAH